MHRLGGNGVNKQSDINQNIKRISDEQTEERYNIDFEL